MFSAAWKASACTWAWAKIRSLPATPRSLSELNGFDVDPLDVAQVSKGAPVEGWHSGLGDPMQNLEDPTVAFGRVFCHHGQGSAHVGPEVCNDIAHKGVSRLWACSGGNPAGGEVHNPLGGGW